MIISTFKTIILAENEHLKCKYCSGTVNKPAKAVWCIDKTKIF